MLVILEGLPVPFQANYESPLTYQLFKSDVLKGLQVDLSGFCVYLSGRLLLSGDSITLPDTESNITILHAWARVLGGKGGFGSQLKAIGAQIQKTTSREACRDLSGRRVRDVNAEKAFSEMAREEKRRAEERRQQKLRRREKRWAQRSVPRRLEDPAYYRSLADSEESVSAALRHAQAGKRPCEVEKTGVKKPVFPGMYDDLYDSESDPEKEKGEISDTNTDSIPPILSVEQISHSPLLPAIPELPLLDQTDSVVEVETEVIQAQSPAESPVNPSTESLNNTADTEPLDDGAITPHATTTATVEAELIDLDAISTREELEKFGLDSLKQTLISLGLKCGGTLQERVGRLHMYKITPKDQLPAFLFAGKGKTQTKKSDRR